MKTALVISSFITLFLTGCVSTDTTVTSPDGTVVHTIVKGVDSASVAAAAVVAGALSPLVIAEK